MTEAEDHKLVLAISSRALFDLRDSHEVYMADGVRGLPQVSNRT